MEPSVASVRVAPEAPPAEVAGIAVLRIDADGHIRESSKDADTMFLDGAGSLIGLPIAALFPRLGQAPAGGCCPLGPHLEYLCNCGTPFRARRCDGRAFVCRLFVDEAAEGGCHLVIREVPPGSAQRVWCLE